LVATVHDQPASSAPDRDPVPRGRAPLAFGAAIFDMDGVVTRTAAVHARAWKEMFDAYLQGRAARGAERFREFTQEGDYLRFVDGRPRYQGVAAFLESRHIHLPPGTPDDAPGAETVCGLGNRKNELFNAIVARDGAGLYESTAALIRELLAAGVKVGLATSSRNSALILGQSGVASLFATVVDGIVSEKLGLAGKPAPDIFLAASANLGVPPAQAIVVEDAVSGVQAGAAGGFALVIGLARENNHAELQRHGADLVVGDLAGTSLAAIDDAVRAKRGERG
jgi:beta-phosphoglucomutase family hydrolase